MYKDPTEFRERFKNWKETGEYELPRFEDGYESFLKTLPDNQKTPGAYNTRRYWELNGKPKNFAEAIGRGMYAIQNDNGVLGWHANSVAYNESNDTYEFMKPNYHPTRWMEQVYGYDQSPEFQKEWKVQYNGPMLSDRYVRREKPGLKVKGGQLPRFADGTSGWEDTEQQKAVQEWGEDWKTRTTAAGKSKVLQQWNASESRPKSESSQQYTKRRIAEETKRTWFSDAADIAKGVKEGALSMSPYTALPYFGAKVGQDVLNGNIWSQTAINAAFGIVPFMPKFVLPNILNSVKNKLNTEGLLDNAIQQTKKFNDVFQEDTYARWILNGQNIPEFKFIWHGRGTNRGIPEHVLRPYSAKDAGLHVTESKKVAQKFANENGVVYSGIDTGQYPDAIYPDITNWTAREWESFLQPSKGYSRMDILKSMDEPYLSPAGKFSLEQELAIRDLADNFKLSLDEINNHARRKLFAGNNQADNELANKLFIDYLRDKGVLLRYKNAYEGGGYKQPSAFVTDMNQIWWDKQKFIKPKSKKQELIESMSDPKLSWAFYKQ